MGRPRGPTTHARRCAGHRAGREALEVERPATPGREREGAALFFILGRAEVSAGRDTALVHLEECSNRLKSLFPEGMNGAGYCLNEIGVLYLKQGDFRKGFDAWDEAARIYLKVVQTSRDGQTYLAVATLMNNLGALALRIGDVESAVRSPGRCRDP